MKIAKLSAAVGLGLGIVGFLIAVLVGEREFGKSLMLIGFVFIAGGLVVLVFFGQPSGSRGIGLRFAAGGFSVCALGVLINRLVPSIGSAADIVVNIGMVTMLGGILFHLFVLARSKKNSDF